MSKSNAGKESRRASPLPKGMGARQVYEELRQKILSLELKPGADLDEGSLVAMLRISRTPVREALIRLSGEGLVVLSPNRGAHVAPIDLDQARAFHEALELLQRAVTHWAALRHTAGDLKDMRRSMVEFERAAARRDADLMIEANRCFHAAIAGACRNSFAIEAYGKLLTQGLRMARVAFSYDYAHDADSTLERHLDRVVDEHRQLFELVEAGEAEAAEILAGGHARLALARLMHTLSSGLGHASKVPVYEAQDMPDVAANR
jgi:DNA-binding GntR family transcriptional regulator